MSEIPSNQPIENKKELNALQSEVWAINAMLGDEVDFKEKDNASLREGNAMEKIFKTEQHIYERAGKSRLEIISKMIRNLEAKYQNLPQSKKMVEDLNTYLYKVQKRQWYEVSVQGAIENTAKTVWEYDDKLGLTADYWIGVGKGVLSMGALLLHPIDTVEGLARGISLMLMAAARVSYNLAKGKKSPAEIKAQVESWAKNIKNGIVENMKTAKPEELASVTGMVVGQVLFVDIGAGGMGIVSKAAKAAKVPQLTMAGLEGAGIIAGVDKGIKAVTAFSGRTMELIKDSKALERMMDELKIIGESVKNTKLPKDNPAFKKLLAMQNATADLYNELNRMINLGKIKGAMLVPAKVAKEGIKFFWDDIALAGVRSQTGAT